jgi:hypothetical protein
MLMQSKGVLKRRYRLPNYYICLLLPNNTSNIPTTLPPRHRLSHNPQSNIPLKHHNRLIILQTYRNQITTRAEREMSWEHSSCRPELNVLEGTIFLEGECGERVGGDGSAVVGRGIGDVEGGVVAV